jgi:hypothetical protein
MVLTLTGSREAQCKLDGNKRFLFASMAEGGTVSYKSSSSSLLTHGIYHI